MIGRTKTAFKFFTYGLLVGILFAPRSGAETRSQIVNAVGQTLKGTMGMKG